METSPTSSTEPSNIADSGIYLDNAATTKIYPEVLEIIKRAMHEEYGNPSSLHARGESAKQLLEKSRTTIAWALGAFPDEIYFTSGATESNNLALVGSALSKKREHGIKQPLIISSVEHASVTKTARSLKREGWPVEYLEMHDGCLDLNELKCLMNTRPLPALVSVMHVQNELGNIFPIADIAQICKEASTSITIHSDAVQSFGKLETSVDRLGVDLMTFCSHKIGGPKGIGALYVRRGTSLFSTACGGGQENGLRSGTQALPLILGFAEAVRLSTKRRQKAFAHVSELKRVLVDEIRREFPKSIINSPEDGSPFIVSFTLPGSRNQRVLRQLSDEGVYISAASACSSNHRSVAPGTWRPKHPLVLELAGIPKSLGSATYRVSFSADTSVTEVRQFVKELMQCVGGEAAITKK